MPKGRRATAVRTRCENYNCQRLFYVWNMGEPRRLCSDCQSRMAWCSGASGIKGHVHYGTTGKKLCLPCKRIASALERSGATLGSWALTRLITSCELCGCDDRRLHHDHDHFTNAARGVLCTNCNFGLGHARDEQHLLQRAIAYVEAQGVWTASDTEHYEQIGVQQFYDAWSKVAGYGRISVHKNRWKRYGLPRAASWAIFERRAITRCQLCEQRFDFDHPQGLGPMSPVLDHTVIDGRTVIRGVIHQRCNALLGHAKDDPVLLAKMVDYIQRAETQSLEERHSTLLDAYLEAFGDDHSAAFRALAMTEQEMVDSENRP